MTFDLASAESLDAPDGFDLSSAQPAAGRQIARQGSGVWDSLVAGGQRSGSGLLIRGKLPDIVLDPHHAKWYENALASGAEIGSDLIQAIAGTVAGTALGGAAGTAIAPGPGTAAGAVLGGGAGMMGVPAEIRESLMRAYQRGDASSSTDFLDRIGIIIRGLGDAEVMSATGKAALVGAATLGMGKVAGGVVGPLLGEATMAGRISASTARHAYDIAKFGAELGTVTVAPAALEGRLPEMQDFADAAIVLGGMKIAGRVASRLTDIYAKTGMTPEQVVADAKGEPTIKEDLAKDTTPIPRAYQALAAEENARAAVPGEKARAVAESPFEEIPQAAGEPTVPTHINYNFTNTTAEVDGALARLSNIYEEEIQQQRRTTVPREQTYAEAGEILNRMIGGEDVDVKRMGNALTTDHQLGARILAKKQMAIGAAENMMQVRDTYLRDPRPENKLQYLASIERSATILSNFLGERAEIGRALEILKSTRTDAERVKQLNQLIETYKKDPDKLAIAMGMMDEPGAMLRAARAAVEPTTWDKFIEYLKAGWVSGPWTHVANLSGNVTFMAVRPVVEQVAAAMGTIRGGERMLIIQPLARVIGNINGAFEIAKMGAQIYKLEGPTGVLKAAWQSGSRSQKAEVAQGGAIGGTLGKIVRSSFQVLGAEDSLFKTFNERGELYSIASKIAAEEGLSPMTREFWQRTSDIVSNPTAEQLGAAKDAGLRLTFNLPLGEKGKAAQAFIRAWHLQWAAPFTQTPGNIAKEMARMSPLAPFVGEWREAFAKGGTERDKAIAELTVGSALMTAVVAMFNAGNISGGSDTQPGKRNVNEAAGRQPYSVLVNGKWYDYSRIQPIGTLVGLAADMANAWDHLEANEQDKVPKILATAFANAITNQTMLQGLTMFVNALSEPDRFFPRMAQSYTAALVPFSGLMRQSAEALDKEQRRIDGIKDAVYAAIPVLRESLLPKINVLTGEPMQTKERFIGQKVTQESMDKVLSEAARLGIGVARAPKNIQLPSPDKKLGKIELTPEQQNLFTTTSGQLAHQVLGQLVASSMWDNLPDLAKKRIYASVFKDARKRGAAAALPGEQRAAMAQEIADDLAEQMR